MFEVFTVLKNDSAKLVSRGANGFVNVSLFNSATSSFHSTFVELIRELVASMFGEVLGEGASLSMEVEEDASTVSNGSRVAAKMGESNEEEVAEAMGEPTMEEYMMKTQDDYGSRIARPKIDDKAHFELKG
ncbi:hypothetical protein Tco_0483558 [Tanacetum coccineum]